MQLLQEIVCLAFYLSVFKNCSPTISKFWEPSLERDQAEGSELGLGGSFAEPGPEPLLLYHSEVLQGLAAFVPSGLQPGKRHKGSNTKRKGVLAVFLARPTAEISEHSRAKLC